MVRNLAIILVVFLAGCGELYLSRGQELILRSNIPESCIASALKESNTVKEIVTPTRQTGRKESKSFIAVGEEVEATVYFVEAGERKIEIGYGYMEMYPISKKRREKHDSFLFHIQESIIKSCKLSESNVTIREAK